MSNNTETNVRVRTRSGSVVNANLVRDGDHPIYLDDTGKFCIQVGERWQRVTTLKAAEREIAKLKKSLSVIEIHGADVRECKLIDVVYRGYQHVFIDDAGRDRAHVSFYIADDPAAIRSGLEKLAVRRKASALKFAKEQYEILKNLVVVTDENFSGLRDGTALPTKADRYSAHNDPPTDEDFY